MKASKRKLILPSWCLILAGITACGTVQRDAKVSAVQIPVVSSANEAVPQPSGKVPQQVSPSESVKVRAAEISVQAGKSAEATIEVIVADGYHINANAASFNYLRPTELKIEPQTKITFGKFIYPKGEMRKFDFTEEPISVYEGTIVIKIPIRAGKYAEFEQTVLRGSVQAQPCNDSACFPSRTIEFSLPIQITH